MNGVPSGVPKTMTTEAGQVEAQVLSPDGSDCATSDILVVIAPELHAIAADLTQVLMAAGLPCQGAEQAEADTALPHHGPALIRLTAPAAPPP